MIFHLMMELILTFHCLRIVKGEEDEDQSGIVKDANVDPFQFMLPQVYCFKCQLGEYLIECLRFGGVDITSANVIIGLDATFFPHQERIALGDFHKGVMKKWERFKKSFGILRMGGEDQLFNQNHSNLIVLYIDEWASIARMAHCGYGSHVPKSQILQNIGEQNWLVGGNRHDIPKPYIIEVIQACVHCNYGQLRNEGGIGEQGGIQPFRQYIEVFTMPRANEEEFINFLKAQHAVRLNLIHVYQRTMPYSSKVDMYVCHCGRKFWGKALTLMTPMTEFDNDLLRNL
jgi:hypothetical protein